MTNASNSASSTWPSRLVSQFDQTRAKDSFTTRFAIYGRPLEVQESAAVERSAGGERDFELVHPVARFVPGLLVLVDGRLQVTFGAGRCLAGSFHAEAR
jgi:hypothetical protein